MKWEKKKISPLVIRHRYGNDGEILEDAKNGQSFATHYAYLGDIKKEFSNIKNAKKWLEDRVKGEGGNKLMNPGKGWIPASFVKVDKANGKVHILTTGVKNPSTRRQKNIAMGFYDATGFHPIRASEDYDPDRSGDWDDVDDTPRKRARKKVAAKKRKKPATKKRKNPASKKVWFYRVTYKSPFGTNKEDFGPSESRKARAFARKTGGRVKTFYRE